jgi:hypothetical protein
MRLVDQWRRIAADLTRGWAGVRLGLTLTRPDRRARAASLLSPASPGRTGETLTFWVRRGGGGIEPDRCTNLLAKLDAEGIGGTLALLETAEREVEEEVPSEGLAGAWATAAAALPPDWSDLYCELELASSDHLDRTALLAAPLNPTRVPGRSAFRFRVAQSAGYGTSPQMTARCLERVDADGITGRLAILRVLSDTHNVATQGPVWRVAGKAV